mmetsp:Transcript_6081/g.23651  ORF Transcript_6081/g.23651 Transcript_6081/m.23651 type:complete len:299 (+) Transcript_6081:974-1870(+)
MSFSLRRSLFRSFLGPASLHPSKHVPGPEGEQQAAHHQENHRSRRGEALVLRPKPPPRVLHNACKGKAEVASAESLVPAPVDQLADGALEHVAAEQHRLARRLARDDLQEAHLRIYPRYDVVISDDRHRRVVQLWQHQVPELSMALLDPRRTEGHARIPVSQRDQPRYSAAQGVSREHDSSIPDGLRVLLQVRRVGRLGLQPEVPKSTGVPVDHERDRMVRKEAHRGEDHGNELHHDGLGIHLDVFDKVRHPANVRAAHRYDAHVELREVHLHQAWDLGWLEWEDLIFRKADSEVLLR